jgi:hypothetical protein
MEGRRSETLLENDLGGQAQYTAIIIRGLKNDTCNGEGAQIGYAVVIITPVLFELLFVIQLISTPRNDLG